MSLEVLIWVHQKYEVSQIKGKLYSSEQDDCAYLAVHNDGVMNIQNKDIGLNQPTNLLFMTCNAQTKNNDNDNNNNWSYEHVL